MKKMLDTSPLVPSWKFCDQDLIGTFFGGGGEAPEGWGDITKEELGDQWMPLPYYYNALKTLRPVRRYVKSMFVHIIQEHSFFGLEGRRNPPHPLHLVRQTVV